MVTEFVQQGSLLDLLRKEEGNLRLLDLLQMYWTITARVIHSLSSGLNVLLLLCNSWRIRN